MFLFALLVACGPKTPPPVFAEPPPPMEAPDLVELPPAEPDDCGSAAAMNPGRQAPFIDGEGNARCRAQVIPPRQVLELLQNSDLAEYWSTRATICHTGRLDDRAYCEYVAAELRGKNADLETELRWQRLAVPVAGLGGFLIGAAVTIAIERIP